MKGNAIANNKKIIIFGAGVIGEKFIYQNNNKLSIHGVWDNHKTGVFWGYKISKPIFNTKYFIIVTSDAYFDIREQLIHIGYKEFENFIPYQIFQKKMAIAYGNCHMEVIKKYLECHKDFSENYGFYPFPQIQIMKADFPYNEILYHCELFLHQSIRKNNRYGEQYASEIMLECLCKTCRVLSVPNLYGLPKYLFPQITIGYEILGSVHPFFVDRNIVLWLKLGKSKDEIKKMITEGGIYSVNDILNMWDDFRRKLCEREKEWDIKISDYIFANYKREKIFCDINHINSKTAKEIAARILEYLGYSRNIFIELPILDGLETFVYPDVKLALGLEFEENIIRKYDKSLCFNNCQMDMDEYLNQICQYILFELEAGVFKEL